MTRRPDAAEATSSAPSARPTAAGRRGGRWTVALAGLAVAAVLTGCSGAIDENLESIARPFDPAPPAEPERVSTGSDPAQEDYPELSEVPDEPPRRPSDRGSRERLRDTLAADRENARYADEALQGDGTRSADAPDQAPAPPDVAMPDDDTGAAGDQLADGEAMTLDARGRTQRRSAEADPGTRAGSGRNGDAGRSARANGDSTGSDSTGSDSPGSARALPADIPQIQPSRQGEPIRLPDAPQFDRPAAGAGGGAAAASSGDAGAGAAASRTQTAQRPASPPTAASGRSQTFAQGDPGRTAGQPDGQRVAVIYFGHGSTGLDGRDRQVLRQVAQMAEQRRAQLRVIGHASSRTAAMGLVDHRMANLETSMKRAEAVADALVSMGVARQRIQVEGRADRDKVYHEFMPTGEAGNRRAEIFLQ